MSTSSPITVLGATGAQGGPVVERLLAAGRPVRAVAGTPAKLEGLAGRGAEPHALDLADQAALERAFDGAAGAFLHLPFVPVEELVRAWTTAIAAALERTGVPIAVFSSSGPVPTTRTGVATLDSKLVADEVLRASAAPIVFLQPAIYLGNLAAPFSAPGVVQDDELRYPPLPSDVPLPFVSVEDQAAMAVAALQRPDLVGRTLPIGEQLTGGQLARGVGEALGRPIRHAPLTPQGLGDAVRPMMGDQVATILTEDYAFIAQRPAVLALDADTAASHRELGVDPTPVASWARTQDWDAAAAVAAGAGA